jgi:hypothetical protein
MRRPYQQLSRYCRSSAVSYQCSFLIPVLSGDLINTRDFAKRSASQAQLAARMLPAPFASFLAVDSTSSGTSHTHVRNPNFHCTFLPIRLGIVRDQRQVLRSNFRGHCLCQHVECFFGGRNLERPSPMM